MSEEPNNRIQQIPPVTAETSFFLTLGFNVFSACLSFEKIPAPVSRISCSFSACGDSYSCFGKVDIGFSECRGVASASAGTVADDIAIFFSELVVSVYSGNSVGKVTSIFFVQTWQEIQCSEVSLLTGLWFLHSQESRQVK